MIRQIQPVGLISIRTEENKNLVKKFLVNDQSTSTVQLDPITVSQHREAKIVEESRGLHTAHSKSLKEHIYSKVPSTLHLRNLKTEL